MFKYNLEKKLMRSATTMLYSPRASIDVKVDNRVQYQGVSTNVSHKKEQGEGGRKGVIDCIIMQFIHLIKALNKLLLSSSYINI